jgi:methyl-accepting chemotaxis protein
MDYREKVVSDTVNAEQSDIDDGTDFIKVDDVSDMLNNIENRVNDIKKKLEPITGLTEVEEIKELIGSLSSDLY